MLEKDKIEKAAKGFLDAWIGNKSYDVNKCVVTTDVELGTRRQFFKDIPLHSYKIISCSKLTDVSAVLKVQMHMIIRGRKRNKRLAIYAVKVKNDWKMDITSLIAH